jgi:hypothetical protein
MRTFTTQGIGGVLVATDPAGKVKVTREHDIDTIVALDATDGEGKTVTVFLDYHSIADLMMSLGAVAVDL